MNEERQERHQKLRVGLFVLIGLAAFLGMVVIEGGKRHLGQSLDVVVTSVLPTSAGRMIFARPRGDEPGGGRDA